ncbi:hypothetical protein IMZ48_40450, partial [Candidatus Bathyarchaeota archaeon]|nr:hypothetical protein [Candidatus Bathyarchaeota archaeon]
MALRMEAADISGSSDIGPPPTSRFAEPDSPQKDPDSPSKPSPQPEEPSESIPESPVWRPAPKLMDTVEEEKADASPVKTLFTTPQTETATATSQNTQPEQPAKSGKRKLAARDESENVAPTVATTITTNTRRKATIIRDKAGQKTLKELAAIRREERGKQAPGQAPALRKPLGAKSTNDDLTSPKKVAVSEKPEKPEKTEKPIRPVKAKQPSEKQPKEPTKRRSTAVDSQPPPPPAVATIEPAPEPEHAEPPTATPFADPERTHLSPTPERKSQLHSRDTPPPADISSHGETSRPSRRNRSQVS